MALCGLDYSMSCQRHVVSVQQRWNTLWEKGKKKKKEMTKLGLIAALIA